MKDEGLKELQCHLLGQTTLMQFECRPDYDHRTTGVVDTFSQKVMTETALFALDHVCQGLQLAFVGTRHSLSSATVIKQCINRLLQHAFLIAHDDVRRIQIEQSTQAIVTVDYTSIQIIEV